MLPGTAKSRPYYGVKWLAFATPSIEDARNTLTKAGVQLSEAKVTLPLEPSADAFSVLGPDGSELVIVERPSLDLDGAEFAIDHIQFLTADSAKIEKFFADVFRGSTEVRSELGTRMKVADATLVFSEPGTFGFAPDDVAPASRTGPIQIGIDHLGFLYDDIESAVDRAAELGYEPLFPPTRYIYKGKPTLYTFSAFATPDNFNIEMVEVDGRDGPHSYYDAR